MGATYIVCVHFPSFKRGQYFVRDSADRQSREYILLTSKVLDKSFLGVEILLFVLVSIT